MGVCSYPGGICLFKFNNRNTRAGREISSEIKKGSIADFEQVNADSVKCTKSLKNYFGRIFSQFWKNF